MIAKLLVLPLSILTLSVSATSAGAQQDSVRAPFDLPAAPTSRPVELPSPCKSTPEPLIDLDMKGIYEENDPTASKVDPKAEALYKEKTAGLIEYENNLMAMTNRYVRSNGTDLGSAACALKWLSDWAGQGALLGDATRQGHFVRKWTLSSLASAYVEISSDRRLDSKQKVAVKKWLFTLAKLVMADYARNPDSTSRRNNHVYWAGWAVGMTGVALQRRDFLEWGIDRATIGLDQIEEDGTLPLEIRRSSRAQTYHLFATVPLVMLAELGARNGYDLYEYNDRALHRLVAFNIQTLKDPKYIIHRTGGTKQVLNEKNMPSLLAWIAPYHHRFIVDDPEEKKAIDRILIKYRPLYNRRSGGDMELFYPAPESAPKKEEKKQDKKSEKSPKTETAKTKSPTKKSRS